MTADVDTVPDEDSAIPVRDEVAYPPKLKALSRIRRDLTDDELQSSGVHKLLIDKYEEAQERVAELHGYQEQFARVDKELAVAKQRIKRSIAFELLSGSALAVGAAMVGYAPNAWATPPTGQMILAFGAVITLGGVVAKVMDA